MLVAIPADGDGSGGNATAGSSATEANAGCNCCSAPTNSVSTRRALGSVNRANGTAPDATCQDNVASSSGLKDTCHPAGSRACRSGLVAKGCARA